MEQERIATVRALLTDAVRYEGGIKQGSGAHMSALMKLVGVLEPFVNDLLDELANAERREDAAVTQAYRPGNALYMAIVKALTPYFPEGYRGLDWDVLPGTIGKLAAEKRQACYDIDLFWDLVANCYDIEPREYFEKEARDTVHGEGNGFRSPLAMAAHYMWKRDPKVEELEKRWDKVVALQAEHDDCFVDGCTLPDDLRQLIEANQEK